MSLEIIEEITLDCNNLDSIPQIKVKQGNNLYNIILVNVHHNNKPLQLNDLTARYVVSRPNGTQNFSDASIENNKIKIILSDKDLACAGICNCEVILSKENTVVFTSVFSMRVYPNVIDDKRIKCSDEYSSIIDVINNANNALKDITQLEQQVSNNEALRVTKETLRNENESQRQQKELERENNFSKIETTSNQVLQENKIQTQNAKTQGDYAKAQGDYAKAQADRVSDTNVSNLINEIDDIKGYIGYNDNNIYGVEVDFTNKSFKRLAGSKNLNAGNDFNSINAYNRRRCILNDNGKVIAYYGDSNYVEDGSSGQIMVEQPKFYYKVVPLELDPIKNGKGYHLRKARYYISDIQRDGFKLHPAFIQNNIKKDKIYLSAYEGCIYDTSSSSYLLNDEQTADFNTDKLSSIKNAKPCGGTSQKLSIANARKLANNRGNGWNLSTIQTISATQLLFLIEYASFNIQEKIGLGITNKSDNKTNLSEISGATSTLGNVTGTTSNNCISYRGEENIFGNIWNYVDGINVYNYNEGSLYIADHNFIESTNSNNYKDSNLTFASPEGYISTFGYSENFDWLFIPSETKGNSALPVGDYFYQNKSAQFWTVVAYGGNFSLNTSAGAFCFSMITPTFVNNYSVGCRLTFI